MPLAHAWRFFSWGQSSTIFTVVRCVLFSLLLRMQSKKRKSTIDLTMKLSLLALCLLLSHSIVSTMARTKRSDCSRSSGRSKRARAAEAPMADLSVDVGDSVCPTDVSDGLPKVSPPSLLDSHISFLNSMTDEQRILLLGKLQSEMNKEQNDDLAKNDLFTPDRSTNATNSTNYETPLAPMGLFDGSGSTTPPPDARTILEAREAMDRENQTALGTMAAGNIPDAILNKTSLSKAYVQKQGKMIDLVSLLCEMYPFFH